MSADRYANRTVLETVAAACLCYDINPDFIKVDVGTKHVRSIFEQDAELPLARAAELIEAIQQNITLRIIKGQMVTEFTSSLIAALENPTAPPTTRIIHWAPKVYDGIQKDYSLIEAASTSQYVGTPSSRLDLDVTVVRQYYSTEYNVYSIQAISNGNLIKFNYKKKLDEGAAYKINGKVKQHIENPNGGRVTVLNYVKI